MKEKLFRILVLIILCLFSANINAQPRTKNSVHIVSEQDYTLVCDCGNKIVNNRLFSCNKKSHLACTTYAPCDRCGNIYRLHTFGKIGGKGVDHDYDLLPKAVSRQIIKKHLVAKKDSCYTIDSIQEGNKYRYIIRAKDCDKILWITIKDEPGLARGIGRGEATSFVSTPGVRKEATISHIQPQAGTAVKP